MQICRSLVPRRSPDAYPAVCVMPVAGGTFRSESPLPARTQRRTGSTNRCAPIRTTPGASRRTAQPPAVRVAHPRPACVAFVLIAVGKGEPPQAGETAGCPWGVEFAARRAGQGGAQLPRELPLGA